MPEPIRKLAIVGASVRGATFSALRAGFDVVAADLFADADLRRACPATRIASGYPDALAEWLAATECDGWLYTGALENHPDLVGRMAKLRPLLGNGVAPLRAARNPLLLAPVLKTAGVSFPETMEPDAAKRLPLDRTWLCKTGRGANGADVWLLDGAAALERAEQSQAFFQRFIGGTSAAAVYACGSDDGKLLGVTRQLVGDAKAGAKPWHYSGSVGPLALSGEVESQLTRLGKLLSQRFQLRGLVGVDLVIAHDRAWVIEINPRYSASVEIVERMTGVSALAAHVSACTDQQGVDSASLPVGRPANSVTPASDEPLVYGKTILYAKRDASVTESFFDWAIKQSAVEFSPCRLADIPHAGEKLAEGQPALTLFVTAPPAAYDGELRKRVGEIESRLYSEE